MHEASKTRDFCGPEFVDKYLSGKVLDIGPGDDLIVPQAIPFDLAHGDANRIGDYLQAQSFDCVHSSHCLEHMRDVPGALRQWWSLVKPGGVLVVAVPHEDLYEQGIWPSIFNVDHKATFRLDKKASWSPVSYDLRNLVQELEGADIESIAVQDAGYDYRWRRRGFYFVGKFAHRISQKIFARARTEFRPQDHIEDRIVWFLGKPLDQTLDGALAQIQVVVRKRAA